MWCSSLDGAELRLPHTRLLKSSVVRPATSSKTIERRPTQQAKCGRDNHADGTVGGTNLGKYGFKTHASRFQAKVRYCPSSSTDQHSISKYRLCN